MGWTRYRGPRPPKAPIHQGPQLAPHNRNNCDICGRPFLTNTKGARLVKIIEKHKRSHQPPKHPKCDICGSPFLTTTTGARLVKIIEKHKRSHHPPKHPKNPTHQGQQLDPLNSNNCDICGRPFLTNTTGAGLVKIIEKHKRSHTTSYYTFHMQILRTYESVEK